MRQSKPVGKFPLGLLFLSIFTAMFKAAILSWEMAGSVATFARLMALDFTFLALLAMAGVAHCRAKNTWIRVMIRVALVLAVAFYVVHSFVLLALDESMDLFDLARYVPETGVVGSFINTRSGIAIGAYFVAVFINRRMSNINLTRITRTAVVILTVGWLADIYTPAPLNKYGLLKIDDIAGQMLDRQPAMTYSPQQTAFYSAVQSGAVEFVQPEPDIILLVVESLSSINSLKVSGQRDLLGVFDRLADQGVLFTNFFANHSASEGGIISLLSGFPPLHYPTATPLMFDEFAIQPSVIGAYREHGYLTEFLTNTDLGFIGMDRYISGLKFDIARGRDEVPEMEMAPRFVQDAPSDRYLYREALARVVEQSASGQPWLLAIATVSTHLPYTHPEGGEDTAAAVWHWSLQRLISPGLAGQGFFRKRRFTDHW
jgi:hypothetical protein